MSARIRTPISEATSFGLWTLALGWVLTVGCSLDWPPPLAAGSGGAGATNGQGGSGGVAGAQAGGAGGGAGSGGGAGACDACPTLSLPLSPTGRSLTVTAGDDLQAAIDAAEPGDEILLEPGATYHGGIVLPEKAGTDPIVIRTSDLATLSEPCTRIGAEHLASLPKIVGTGGEPALFTDRGHDWKLVGVELGVEGTSLSDIVVKLGSENTSDPNQIPRRISFDRVYVRGDPTHGTLSGIWINAQEVSVNNSRIADLWEPVQSNLASHAIRIDNSPGSIVVFNNFLESAWEPLIVGGYFSALADTVTTGIEARYNEMTRPARWVPLHSEGWHLRGFVGLHNARQVTIDANELSLALFRAAFVLEPDRRGGQRPWAEVGEVVFSNNRVEATEDAFWLHATDPIEGGPPFTHDITLENNLITDVAHDFILLGGQTTEGIIDLRVVHNTVLQDNRIALVDNGSNDGTFVDNVLVHGSYGILCNGGPVGEACLAQAFSTWDFDFNLVVTPVEGDYPQKQNQFVVADPGFVNSAAGDYALTTTSPGSGKASDGKDMGIDSSALESAHACRTQRSR